MEIKKEEQQAADRESVRERSLNSPVPYFKCAGEVVNMKVGGGTGNT